MMYEFCVVLWFDENELENSFPIERPESLSLQTECLQLFLMLKLKERIEYESQQKR